MPTPTVIHRTTIALTPRGRLAVQLARTRTIVAGLNAADRAWAADALVLLLAECRPVAATGKGA